jgi:hypothetical protein
VDPWHALLVLVAAIAIAEGLLIVGLMRQVGGIYLQIGPPRPGHAAGQGPDEGDTIDPAVLGLTRPAVLTFLSPSCSLCPAVAKAIPVAAGHFREVDFIPAVVGPATDEKLAYAASLGDRARTDLDGLYEEWEVGGTPFAVGFASDGRIRMTGIVNSLPQIETIAEALVADAQRAQVVTVVERELEGAV